MKTYYLWREDRAFSHAVTLDDGEHIPERSTLTAPAPELLRPVWGGGSTGWQESSVDELKADLKDQVTAIRWAKETGGIMAGGVRVATGLQDQNRIASVLSAMQVAQVDGVDFKAESGWVYLTANELQGIAAAITAHVQGCFSAERAHHEAIDALADVASVDEYDLTTGWPR